MSLPRNAGGSQPLTSTPKILVRAPNWIGDGVMTIPTLSALRLFFKEAEIVLLAKPPVAALFSQHPDVDRVLPYEDPGIHAGFSGFCSLIRMVRNEHFDLAFLFQNALEAALIAFFAGIPKRVGYSTDGRGLLLTRSLPKRKAPPHRHDAYLALMTLVDGPAKGPMPHLLVPAEERKAARTLLSSAGRRGSGPLIGINAGAAYGSAKRWSTDRFAAVADQLSEAFQAEIVLFGGPSEVAISEAIQSKMQTSSIVLAGKTSVREMIASVSQCRLFITNDSGPMHIASALGVPQVAIFGPTKPEATFSRGKNDRMVQKKADCAPCRHRICPTDHRCMEGVSPDTVFKEASRLLSAKQKKKSAVFLDRDGTINVDSRYIDSIKRFSLIPGAAAAIARLNRHGIPVIVVTNQSGIARGLFSESFLNQLHLHLQRLLAKNGARLDGIYYCPHHPDFQKNGENKKCACRKPELGMIEQAALDHNLDFSKSYVVGDKPSDIGLAQNGARSILVQTGEGIASLKKMTRSGLHLDHVAEDLTEAVEWILRQNEQRNPAVDL
ncbi:MAG: lipopolysaccharide heptosyltransferase II [Nitrospiria bacterium]